MTDGADNVDVDDINVMENINEINVETGEYQVMVHIIEAVNLKSRDSSGTSDPVSFFFKKKINRTDIK